MGVLLGRPPGPGPVFEFEWVTASRRWQAYALRSLFVLFLLAALIVTWSSTTRTTPTTLRMLAEIGSEFYTAVIGTELTLVLLAAPAATAGAICIDRARGTLTHLLVTDLRDTEIVLGKLAARLVPVLGLVVCGLPVLALLVLLGGVDPDALLGAFVVTVGVALLGCSLALAFSLWAGKTHEALLGTYAVWGLWLLSDSMLRNLGGALGVTLPVPPWTANPYYLILAPYWWPSQVTWLDYLVFLAVTSAISAALVALAVLSLRRVCTRQDIKRTRRGWGWSRHFPVGAAISGRVAFLRSSIGPPLDFNPVLWREWHRNRPSRWSRSVGALYIVLATTFSIIAILSGSAGTAAWTNGLQVSIGLLMLSVSAATSLAEERVRGSLDVLMTTPLSTREIVLGKWLGAFRLVPWLTVLPGLVLLLAGNNQSFPTWIGAPVLVAYILACGAAVTSLGLGMATWCTRLGRAVGLTVSAYILLTVGWMFLVMMIFRHGPSAEVAMMASPFFGPGMITAVACESRMNYQEHWLTWLALWTVLYSGLAVVLLIATLSTFNRCLGRVEEFLPFGLPWKEEPVVLIRVETAASPELVQQ